MTTTDRVNIRPPRFAPAEYESRTYPKRGGLAVSEQELLDIIELLGEQTGLSVLDVGMGTGRILRKLTGVNATVVGLDADPGMVKHFAEKSKISGNLRKRDFHLIVGVGEHLPFKEGSFSAVICIRVLRYFVRPKEGVNEMCYVLRNNGRLILEFANILRPQALSQLPQYFRIGRVYPHLFWRRRVLAWISSQGMQVEEVRAWHKMPVEILAYLDNPTIIHILLHVESALQRILPLELFSRSLVLSAVKTLSRRDDSGSNLRTRNHPDLGGGCRRRRLANQ